MGVFEVQEFESYIKIEVAPFRGTLNNNFAGNLSIIPERWGGQAGRRLHRICCPILHQKMAHLRKFSKVQIWENALKIVRAFFGTIYGIRSLWMKLR